jgi:hypothetical protein
MDDSKMSSLQLPVANDETSRKSPGEHESATSRVDEGKVDLMEVMGKLARATLASWMAGSMVHRRTESWPNAQSGVGSPLQTTAVQVKSWM